MSKEIPTDNITKPLEAEYPRDAVSDSLQQNDLAEAITFTKENVNPHTSNDLRRSSFFQYQSNSSDRVPNINRPGSPLNRCKPSLNCCICILVYFLTLSIYNA